MLNVGETCGFAIIAGEARHTLNSQLSTLN